MIDLPTYYVPMPITAGGDGPAEPHETVATLHQVWDANSHEVCTCRSEELARLVAASINAHLST